MTRMAVKIYVDRQLCCQNYSSVLNQITFGWNMPNLPKQYYQELYTNINEDHYSESTSDFEAAKAHVPSYYLPNKGTTIKRYDPGGYECPRCTKSDYEDLDYSLTTEVSRESITVSYTDDEAYSKPMYSSKEQKSYLPIQTASTKRSVYECPPKRTCCKAKNPALTTKLPPKAIAVAYAQNDVYSKPFRSSKGACSANVTNNYSKEEPTYESLPKTRQVKNSKVPKPRRKDAYTKPICSSKGPCSTNVTNSSSNHASPIKKYEHKEKLNYEYVPHKRKVRDSKNSTIKTEISQESITVYFSEDDTSSKPYSDASKTNSITITKSSSSVSLTSSVSDKKFTSAGSILKNLNIPKEKNAALIYAKHCTSSKANAAGYKKPRSVASILKDIQMSRMHGTDSEKSINSVCLDCASTTSLNVKNKCRSNLDDDLKEIVKRYTMNPQVNNVFDYGKKFSTPKSKEREHKKKSKTTVHIPKKDDRKRIPTRTKQNCVPSVTSMDIADTDNPSSVDMVARGKESSRSRKASFNLAQQQRSGERYPSRYYLNERFGASSSIIDPNLQLLPEPDLIPSKRSQSHSRPKMPELDYYSTEDLEMEPIYSYPTDSRSRRTTSDSSKEKVKITVEKPIPMVSSRMVTEEELMEELESSRRRSTRDHRSRERRKSSREPYHTRLGVEKPKPFVYSTSIKTAEEMEELESQYFPKSREERRRSKSRSREHVDDNKVVYAKTITQEQLEQIQIGHSNDSKKKKPLLTTSFDIIAVEDPNSAVYILDENKYDKKEPQKKTSRKKTNFYLPQDGAKVACCGVEKPLIGPKDSAEIMEMRKESVSVQVDEDGTSREQRSSQSVESQTVFSRESQTGGTQTTEEERTEEAKKHSADKKGRRWRSKEKSILEAALVEDVIRPLKKTTCSDTCDVVNPCGGVRKLRQ